MRKNKITQNQSAVLLGILKIRFLKNTNRHKSINWDNVERKLLISDDKLFALNDMENTGGEPDVVAYDKKTDEYTFFDCAAESPKARRSLCYDHDALASRKEYKPVNSAVNMASEMGVELLDEEQYRYLQQLGEFDLKTSSWLKTPTTIRELGGSIFGDRRFNQVFIYHNGAESYYAGRGFRTFLKV